jgi:hypothetical protein
MVIGKRIGLKPRAYALAAANGCQATVRRTSARARRGSAIGTATPFARLAPVLSPPGVAGAARLAAAPNNGLPLARNAPGRKDLGGLAHTAPEVGSIRGYSPKCNHASRVCWLLHRRRMARGHGGIPRYSLAAAWTVYPALLLFASHNDGYLTLGTDQPGCPSCGHSPG